MSDSAVLNGSVRKPGNKGHARRLRNEGIVPGVVYGLGDNVVVGVNRRDIIKAVESPSGFLSVLTTKFEGDSKERNVLIKQLDAHPIDDKLLHVDLLEIDLSKKVKLSVNIEIVGISKGVKEQGGVLTVARQKLEVEALPKDIPPHITIDVTELATGDSLSVKDLSLGEKVSVMEDVELTLVSVAVPKAVVEEEPGEEEEGASTEEKTEEKSEPASE